MRLKIPHTYTRAYHKALQVVAYLATPVATIGDPIHLDGLVAGDLSGRGLERLRFAKCGVRRNGRTVWWWAASAHYGKIISRETEHVHRQFPFPYSHLLMKKVRRINISSGRERSFQIPIPVLLYKTLTWYCVADRKWLEKKLQRVHNIGKKWKRGIGLVHKWEITEVEVENCFFNFRADGSPARCLPYIWRPQLGYPIPAAIRPSYWDERNVVECLIPDYDID